VRNSAEECLVFGEECQVAGWRSGVLFDLRAKDAKKWKGASFFAMCGLSEAEAGRNVEMENRELERRSRTVQR
jgi:hypothetical protein